MRTVFSGLHCSKLFGSSQREDLLHLRNIPSRKHSGFLIALNEIHYVWIIFQESWLINKLDQLKGNESEDEKSIKMWTYHTIRTQWNTFTVIICTKWEWWVFSLAWNMGIAESDNKQFSTWVQLVLNDHCWETREYLEIHKNLYTECSKSHIRQNSRFCSSVSKDLFFLDIWLQDKAFTTLNTALEFENLSKNCTSSQCSPYLIEPHTMMTKYEHFEASANTVISRLLVVFRLKTVFRCMVSRVVEGCWYDQ